MTQEAFTAFLESFQGILDSIWAVVTNLASQVARFLSLITSNYLILLFFLVTMVGLGISVLRRLAD